MNVREKKVQWFVKVLTCVWAETLSVISWWHGPSHPGSAIFYLPFAAEESSKGSPSRNKIRNTSPRGFGRIPHEISFLFITGYCLKPQVHVSRSRNPFATLLRCCWVCGIASVIFTKKNANVIRSRGEVGRRAGSPPSELGGRRVHSAAISCLAGKQGLQLSFT